MTKLKVATTSAAITLVLATTASHAKPNAQLIRPVSEDAFLQQSAGFDEPEHKTLASQNTKSGIKSQFDSALGKATFVWAPSSVSSPDISKIAPAKRAETAANFYLNALTGFSPKTGNSPKKLMESSAVLASMHDTEKGAKIAKYKQEISGVEVFNREYNIVLNAKYSLVASSGFFASKSLSSKQIAPDSKFGSVEKAIQFAVNDAINGELPLKLSAPIQKGNYSVFNAVSLAKDKIVGLNPRAKRVYYDSNTELIPAYYIEVEVSELDSVDSSMFGYVIDALNGKILFKNNLAVDDSVFHYRAYANDNKEPMQGPHGDVIPALEQGSDTTIILPAPIVSIATMPTFSQQDPWLPEDATTTSGNNAFAYGDVVAPSGFSIGDLTAEVTSDRTFDYVLDDAKRANSIGNRKAAIVNLFYMTNFLHNYYYDYGFDEAAGNAQLSNYGRGGLENDPLMLEAQDYTGLNNANMTTPADGFSPRMQQYLWTDKDATVGEDWGTIVTHPEGIDALKSRVAPFGPLQYKDVEGLLVRINDGEDSGGAASINDGCEPAINEAALLGNIAVIDRGACSFVTKVLSAQNAGAIGAIIVNNVDDGSPSPMGGSDNTVVIPSQGINYAEGTRIYTLIDTQTSVEARMFSTFPLKDSTFDNGIIAHEFGHYIQNRLIGNANGLANFQGRAMGEGWGDFHTLLFLSKASDIEIAGNEEFALGYAGGTYVEDFYNGIRRVPYSTNMDINPYTFEHIETGAGPDGYPATMNLSPHSAGEIWAIALWEVYVALINHHGFDEAKDRMSRYIIEGYKLTPITPVYTEARDAILASIIANDPDDFDLAIAAFAKRGLGLGAISPERFSKDLSGVVASNKTQLAVYSAVAVNLETDFDGATAGFCSANGILDKGETGIISVTIENVGSEVLSGVTAQIDVIGDADITLENNGVVSFEDLLPFTRATSSVIRVTVNDAEVSEDVIFSVTFPESIEGDDIVEAGQVGLSSTLNYAFDKVAPVGNAATDDMEDISSLIDWKVNIMNGADLGDLLRLSRLNTGNTRFFQNNNPSTNLGLRTLKLNDVAAISDIAYESNEMEVGFTGQFSMSFWHAYFIETGFDGGVIEISVNNTDWVDVTQFGTFEIGGYNLVIGSNVADQPLAGRPVFSGRNPVTANGGRETINFGSVLNGSVVKFRFRIATDSGVRDLGWFIDNVTYTNIETPVFSKIVSGEVALCDNSLPRITATEAVTLNEGSIAELTASAQDRNASDVLSYEWTQIGGTAVSISDANSGKMSFTAPDVSLTTDFTFQVAVSDGRDVVTANSVVTVNNIPEPAAPVVSKKSSGSTGLLALLLVPIILFRRANK